MRLIWRCSKNELKKGTSRNDYQSTCALLALRGCFILKKNKRGTPKKYYLYMCPEVVKWYPPWGIIYYKNKKMIY